MMPSATDTPRPTRNILLVHRAERIAVEYQAMLLKAGFKVTLEVSGSKALEIFAGVAVRPESRFDAVLIGLPEADTEMTPDKLAEFLKKVEQTYKVSSRERALVVKLTAEKRHGRYFDESLQEPLDELDIAVLTDGIRRLREGERLTA